MQTSHPATIAAAWLDRVPVATPAPVAAPQGSPLDLRLAVATMAAMPLLMAAALFIIN